MSDLTAREQRLDAVLLDLAQSEATKDKDATMVLREWLNQGLDNPTLRQKVLLALYFNAPASSPPPATPPPATGACFSRRRRPR
jgi:hypothetical protein